MAGMLGCGGGPEILFFPSRCFEAAGLEESQAAQYPPPDDATEPATLDPLSSIAPLFRVRPEIQEVCRFALQWEVVHEAEPAGFAQFHIVTNGNCLLERYSG